MDVVLESEDLPREDGFSWLYSESLRPGGSCANVLVTVSNLGGRCAIVAKVGDDDDGRLLREDLHSSGISTRYLFFDKNKKTLRTYITVTRKGTKTILVRLENSLLALSEEDVLSVTLDHVKVFYTDLLPAKPALSLARLCKARNIPIFFNLQCSPSFMELCGIQRSEVEEMAALCDIFCGGREAVREFAGYRDSSKAVKTIHKRYGPSIATVVTLGESGSLWIDRNHALYVPSYKVEVADTTGAGDAFAGGLIYALFLGHQDPKSALLFANACGALKCTQKGPRLKGSKSDVLMVMNNSLGQGRQRE